MRRSRDAAKFRNRDWIELSVLTDNCSKLYPARGIRRCANKHREILPKSLAKTDQASTLESLHTEGKLDVESKTVRQVVIELGAFLLPPAICWLWRAFQKKVVHGRWNNWNQMPRRIFLDYWISRILAQGFDRLPQGTGRIKLQSSWRLF
jgi:hypothetical protein